MKSILRSFFALILSNILLAQVSNFEGIQYSGEKPPDPVIAVSNNYIVQAVNKKLAVFNKSGAKLFEQSFSDFFSGQTPPSTIFDPKVAYDQYSNRFILLAAGKNTGGGNSNYMLAVTQNSDPTGSWYKYKLNAEDQNLTQYDIDFPGLGYDEEAIYLTSHQYDDVQVSYYPKITILNKSEVYSGTITYRKDFKDFSSGGSYPAKLKPMRKFGTLNGYYLVNTESAGQIRIWKIENPLSSTNATRSVAATITLGSYSTISNAIQKGTTNTVDIGDYSISDVVCIDGYLYGAYTAQNTTSNGSMIVYFKINTANNFDLMINGKIESPNNYYYYPVLHPDNEGNIVFVFNKSSSNDYIGVAWTIRYAGNSNIEPIQWLKQGTTWYYNLLNTRNRWGDYCGIALDPANGNRVWICGEWALTNTQWSTSIGEISTGQTIDFYFTNTIHDENTGILNTNAGGTFIVNYSTVNSGFPLPLETGNNFSELTNNERFGNWNSLGFTFKHNHWNNDLDRKFLSNNFEASNLSIDQKAYFRSLNYTRIETRLEGQLMINQGIGKFQDPWYVKGDGTQPGDYWKEYTSYYEPTGKEGATEKGVFLDQGGTGFTPPYYSVKVEAVQDIYLTQTGKTHKFYFQNWGGTNVNYQSANALETPVVFTLDGATAQANLKGTQLSNNSNAFANNSQRKLIKTPDGVMHLTYESIGRIWYETSADNGTTWQLMNGGKPLDNGAGKCPAIDYCYNKIAIVYQQKNGDYSTLQLKAFIASGNQYVYNFTTTLTTLSGLYSSDANPAFAWSNSGKMIVVWQNYSLIYISAILSVSSYSSSYTYIDGGTVNSTNSLSKFPSISTDKYSLGGRLKYQIVWQQDFSNGQSAIYYCPITLIYGTPPIEPLVSYQSTTVQPLEVAEWYSVQSTPKNISSGSFPYNYKPSVIAFPDSTARFCWIGQYYLGSSDVRVAFKGSNNTRFWYFGNNIRSPQITVSDDYTQYYVIWNEINDNSIKFTDNTTLSTIYNLNTTGKAVQLSNGANRDNMYALVFNNQYYVYFFKTSPSIGSRYALQKSTLASNQIVGRGGVVLKDSVGFYFSVENISIDNQPVDFVEIADNEIINNIDQLNEYLLSEPFTLSGNSGLNFDIAYGTTSTAENKALENKNTVSYSLDLIDANSSQVLTNIKKIVFDKNNLPSIETQAFQINSGKLTNSKTVQLKLTVKNNFDGQCLLTESYSDIKGDVLAKSNTIEINDGSISNVKDFALWQNSPNPFNPSTKISWQSPVGSHQILKVYDILGNEVATLVDEYREAGRYEINFDASNLASGVYIYKIQAGEFVSSKKMILLK